MSRRFVRYALPVALLALLALLPSSALGAKPEIFHMHFHDEIPDIDVCGFNVDLVVDGQFTDRLYFDGEGNPVRFASTSSGQQTFTADDGTQVIVRFAQLYAEGAPIVDEAAGTVTIAYSFKGLPEMIKTPHGAVLLRDAGFVTFVDTIDLATDTLISTEVVVEHGPHPDLDSDFTAFCDVMSEVFG
jgi:hypothetical protein